MSNLCRSTYKGSIQPDGLLVPLVSFNDCLTASLHGRLPQDCIKSIARICCLHHERPTPPTEFYGPAMLLDTTRPIRPFLPASILPIRQRFGPLHESDRRTEYSLWPYSPLGFSRPRLTPFGAVCRCRFKAWRAGGAPTRESASVSLPAGCFSYEQDPLPLWRTLPAHSCQRV